MPEPHHESRDAIAFLNGRIRIKRIHLSALLALVGFAMSVLAFYPGLFTFDSLVQFDQAQSGQFSDWHPPVMAALWRLLLFVHQGPAPLFLLHLALFWSAAFAVGDALSRRGSAWAALFPLVGLMPFLFNFVGVLWKDVGLAASWFFAVAWTLRRREAGGRPHAIELTAIWLAFLYGALLRSNSILGAAPLALYLVGGDVWSRKLWPQLTACVLAPALLLVSQHLVNDKLLHARHEYAEDSLMLFDLTAISHALNTNLIPGPWTEDEARRIPGCYQPERWEWYGYEKCVFISNKYDDLQLWGSKMVFDAWWSAVRTHPGLYLQHRLTYTNELMRFGWEIPAQDIWTASDMQDAQYAHHPGRIYNAYEAVTFWLQSTALFRPWMWLLLSGLVFAASFRLAAGGARRFAGAVSASAIIYLLTYFVFGVAPDFRYAYWSICATVAALAALLCAPRTPAHPGRSAST